MPNRGTTLLNQGTLNYFGKRYFEKFGMKYTVTLRLAPSRLA